MSQPEPNPGVLSEPDPPVRRRNPTLAPFKGFPGGTSSKEPTCQCRRRRKWGFDPWVRKIPCRKKWQPTPVSLPGEFPWTVEPGGLQSTFSVSDKTEMTEHACVPTAKKIK